jgi:hypothetical protein
MIYGIFKGANLLPWPSESGQRCASISSGNVRIHEANQYLFTIVYLVSHPLGRDLERCDLHRLAT